MISFVISNVYFISDDVGSKIWIIMTLNQKKKKKYGIK